MAAIMLSEACRMFEQGIRGLKVPFYSFRDIWESGELSQLLSGENAGNYSDIT